MGVFTHRNFYTGFFYTEKPLHKTPFTNRGFYTEESLHKICFYTQTHRFFVFLQRGTFTHRNVYTDKFYTEEFLHTEVFTQKLVNTELLH